MLPIYARHRTLIRVGTDCAVSFPVRRPSRITREIRDHQPDGEEIPSLVEGVLEALGAIEEAQLHHIGLHKIGPRVPPPCEVAVFETLSECKLFPAGAAFPR